jgi:hypothetical protein
MQQPNLGSLAGLDLSSLSVADLASLENSVLRTALIEIAEHGDALEMQTNHQNHGTHSNHTTHQSSLPQDPPASEIQS